VKNISWFIFFILFAVSCLDQPDCFRLNNDLVGISFHVLGSNSEDVISINSIKVNGVTAFENLETSADISFLPIRLDRSTNTANISILSKGVEKQINLSYDSKVQFVSEECGVRYIYSSLELIDHDFDRLDIVNNSPGRDSSSVNIIIYRCPEPDSVGIALYQLTLPASGKTTSRSLPAGFNSVNVDGAGNYYTEDTLSTLELPVNVLVNKANYVFDFADDFGYTQNIRTLSLGYAVVEEVRYEACGLQKFVNELSIQPSEGIAFDSASIIVQSGDTLNILTDPVSTNINLYRCPPTNVVQVAFFTAEAAVSKTITSITSDYSGEVLYADTRASRVQLPLNPNATSTVFTIQYEGVTETLALNYSWSAPRATLFKPGRACSDRQVITDLSITANANAELVENEVLYPAITNINLEVAE
jgi:hypothetical protein